MATHDYRDCTGRACVVRTLRGMTITLEGFGRGVEVADYLLLNHPVPIPFEIELYDVPVRDFINRPRAVGPETRYQVTAVEYYTPMDPERWRAEAIFAPRTEEDRAEERKRAGRANALEAVRDTLLFILAYGILALTLWNLIRSEG
jgi:hypothetical protein